MIVVLDTNIVASATYWRGKPAHCLEAWVNGKFDLAISHPILSATCAAFSLRVCGISRHVRNISAIRTAL